MKISFKGVGSRGNKSVKTKERNRFDSLQVTFLNTKTPTKPLLPALHQNLVLQTCCKASSQTLSGSPGWSQLSTSQNGASTSECQCSATQQLPRPLGSRGEWLHQRKCREGWQGEDMLGEGSGTVDPGPKCQALQSNMKVLESTTAQGQPQNQVLPLLRGREQKSLSPRELLAAAQWHMGYHDSHYGATAFQAVQEKAVKLCKFIPVLKHILSIFGA